MEAKQYGRPANLTLEGTWTECLRMWNDMNLSNLIGQEKRDWMRANDYEFVACNCFFCDYDSTHGGSDCTSCPGRLVDPDFNCEIYYGEDDEGSNYNFYEEPVGFLEKIEELYEEYKEAKNGS